MVERADDGHAPSGPSGSGPGTPAPPSTASTSAPPPSDSTAAAAALDTSTASLQALAQQQVDYRRKLALLQHQQDVWQLVHQQQQRQQTGNAAYITSAGLATREDRMQHLHQTFQQRIVDQQAASQADNQATSTPTATSTASTPLPESGGIPVAVAAAATARLTPQELERMRQEQLERIQQFQFQQALQAAAQQAAAQQSALAFHVAGGRVNSQSEAQQQVLRQQQALQGFLQKQQHERLLLQHQQLLQQQRLRTAAAAQSSAPSPSSQVHQTAAPSPTSTVSKLKRKSKLESQMEVLLRALARISGSKSSAETALALDKMTTWVHRCVDVDVLRLAARDLPIIEAAQRIRLTVSNTWTVELQAKCAGITAAMTQLIKALEAQLKDKPAVAGTESEMSPEEREQVYAALKAQILYKQKPKAAKKSPVASAIVASTGQKRALQVDTGASADKKARSDSAPVVVATSHSTPGSTVTGLKPRPVYARATPVSPREAQRVFELDLSMRTTISTAQDDVDEKLYFPTKVIAKVMRKALPDDSSSGPKPPSAAPTTPEETKTSGDHPTSSEDELLTADTKPSGAQASAGAVATTSSHVSRPLVDLPPIKLSDDAVTLMQECATEFMLFLTSEARDHSALENPRKKATACSISGANALDGLRNLGFSPYAKVLDVYNTKIKCMLDSAAQRKLERKLERQKQAKQAAADAKQAMEKAQQADKAVASVVATMVSDVSTSGEVKAPAVAGASTTATAVNK